ncbi:MAG: bifunctional metallophosphatase/5'-nucleotidase [Candidatus Aminicenantes bacterium]|nr:MAG: bifunctional metallophosphatase/5'-nucleotidase [Candidatus Aminicenantes bacterium]
MNNLKSRLCVFIFFFLAVLPLFSETIVILHSNDTHGIYKPFKIKMEGNEEWIGGMEAMCHHINAVREKEDYVFYIDTGDIMTGTLATELVHKDVFGGLMIEFLNNLKCDAWCFGNHEFDLGLENALGLAGLANFPTLMANIVYKESGKIIPVKPYHISNRGGLKVGFVAFMSEKFLIEVLKERVESLDVLPVIPILRSKVCELDEKTDLIVVMFHGKYHEAVNIAQNVSGIDVMLVASEEGRIEEVNGVLVQSTMGHQRSLGYLKVDVCDDRVVDYEGKQILLWANDQLKPSPQIKTLVEYVDEKVGSEYAKVIGKAKQDYFYKGEFVENVLGNWMTDVMRWKTGSEISFHNSGGIRDNILAGPITKGDIFEVSPFRNTLVVFELTGKEIKEILEHDVEKDWDRLQVSGMSYSYHHKSSKPFGQRIDRIVIAGKILVKKGKLLHPDKVFTVVSNNYLVSQAKDKYFGFPVKEIEDTGMLINQVLIAWLEKHKVLDYRIEGRIVKIDN